MTIIFIINSLQMGGAEKVVCKMANYFQKRNNKVYIIILDNEPVFFYLSDEIEIIKLNTAFNSKSFIRSIIQNCTSLFKILKCLKRIHPDIVLTFMPTANILGIISCKFFQNFPIIISERTNPVAFPLNTVWNHLRKILYPKADYLVTQSNFSKNYFEKICSPNKVVVIQNSIDIIPECKVKKENIILNVGRLDYSKAQDLLINAFARLRTDDWKLEIAGDGPEMENLKLLINKLNLEKKVKLLGKVKSIYDLYFKASVFVLSSRFEGFPNSLCEAMSVGIASISTNCESGPSDLIISEKNGILVPVGNIDALAKAIESLIVDPGKRLFLGKNAIESLKKFHPDIIMSKWIDLINSIYKF